MQQTRWDRRGVLWGLSEMAEAGILGASQPHQRPRSFSR
jgi:hypothetical protein